MPVFAGQTALAALDFHGLGGKNTRDLRDGFSVRRPTCPARGIMAHADRLGQRDLADARIMPIFAG